jgi:hypothetical protein
MSLAKKYSLLTVFVFFTGIAAWSQAARSPFTSFGIGEPYGNALINTQGMAGVGVAQPQFFYINNQNPALLVYNTLTGFQAGMLAERRTIRQDTLSEAGVGGNMNYLVTAFPVKPTKWTTSLGLMPYSTVKFKIAYIGQIENSTDSIYVTEEGSGGLAQFYWSNGVRLTPDLAIGLKASYIFSSIKNTYSNRLYRTNQVINYNSTVEDKSYVKDFAFTAGISYSVDSLFKQDRYRLSFGATYSLATDLDTKLSSLLYRSIPTSAPIDSTVLNSTRGSIHIPAAFTAGISLSRGLRWSVGTEFSYQDWSTYKSITQNEGSLGKSWRGAVGGEITPDPASENFLNRITYRLGLSMEQYPFMTNSKEVKDLGINFGFSLPSGRYSSLDFALKIGKRGNQADNLLEETYFKVYFGFNFNDQWFIKRRFD